MEVEHHRCRLEAGAPLPVAGEGDCPAVGCADAVGHEPSTPADGERARRLGASPVGRVPAIVPVTRTTPDSFRLSIPTVTSADQITVRRLPNRKADLWRAYKVHIDGEPVGKL